MSISNLTFIFFFLPVTLIAYFLVGERFKEYVLVFFSLLFYSLASLQYFLIFLIAIIITIAFGRCIFNTNNPSRKKLLLICGLVFNIGLLLYFKFHDSAFSILNKLTSTTISFKSIILPIGISFYTFKAVSYLVDVYKDRIVLDKPIIHDALYLSFFGQIISGPLARYNNFDTKEENKFDCLSNGLWRFVIGFLKKVLIANVLSNIVNEVYGASFAELSTAFIWLGAICYSLELYYDFSGYSDMAIGITQMFGYHCPENFDHPYMSESISQFWRRWHITLGAWFKDYIYIPLGGSRCKINRLVFNLFIVWLLTGIWHGSSLNFIFWGLAYFVLITFEKIFNIPNRFKNKVVKFLYHLFTVLVVNFLWVIFRTDSLINGLVYIKNMLLFRSNPISDARTLFLIKEYLPFLLVAFILCFPISKYIKDKLIDKPSLLNALETIGKVILLLLFILAISYIVVGQNNPFAYANF